MLRIDSSLNFANAHFITEQIAQRVDETPETSHVLIDCRGVNTVDATAIAALLELLDSLGDSDVNVVLTQPGRLDL